MLELSGGAGSGLLTSLGEWCPWLDDGDGDGDGDGEGDGGADGDDGGDGDGDGGNNDTGRVDGFWR